MLNFSLHLFYYLIRPNFLCRLPSDSIYILMCFCWYTITNFLFNTHPPWGIHLYISFRNYRISSLYSLQCSAGELFWRWIDENMMENDELKILAHIGGAKCCKIHFSCNYQMLVGIIKFNRHFPFPAAASRLSEIDWGTIEIDGVILMRGRWWMSERWFETR